MLVRQTHPTESAEERKDPLFSTATPTPTDIVRYADGYA